MEMADNAACARMEAIRKWPISENAIITTAAADFRIALPHGGRLIGMDVGTRTIGLALCDAGWMIASAAHTIARGKFSKDKVQLAAFMLMHRAMPSEEDAPSGQSRPADSGGKEMFPHRHLRRS
jgi:hypothetical protein